MRSALFVDFDNVYSGLARLGPAYAEAFARKPSDWMTWLTDTVAHPHGADTSAKRRILVRRCYLNPEPYKRFRIGFSRAGFEIVDCPPMTSAGKTSTDIHMVLDIVDVLQAQTRFDEFIVFSADADFTPVLRKLRREDRRTTIFAAGATSAAYDASADLILDPEAFIHEGLGFTDEEPAADGAQLDALIAQAEAIVWRTVDQADSPVPLPTLTKTLAQQLPELPHSDWAGKGSFGALLKSLPLAPLRIDRERNALLDPRRLPASGTSAAPVGPVSAAPVSPPAPPPALPAMASPPAVAAPSAGAAPASPAETLQRLIAAEVAASGRPIAVARLAQVARERIPGIEANWLGQGSWKRLLETINPPGVRIVWHQLAGYALDPDRHSLDFAAGTTSTVTPSPQGEHAATVGPLLEAGGLPLLSPERYLALLMSLSAALQVKPFVLAAVTKSMRDQCQEQQLGLSRETCNTFVRTLLFNGWLPDSEDSGFDPLAARACGIVLAAAAREGLRPTDDDRSALAAWLTGAP